MKKRNLLSGFALALLMTLGIAGLSETAHAQGGEWTCDNGANPVPDGYDGSVDIQYLGGLDPSTCMLGNKHVTGGFGVSGYPGGVTFGSITADNGWVAISDNATGGDITAGAGVTVSAPAVSIGSVTAGTTGSGGILVSATNALSTGALTNTGGNIVAGSLGSINIASINNTNGGIMLQAKGLIEAPSITNKNGDVQIFGNLDQTSGSPLVIGSGGIGYIHNNGDYGFGIYISSPIGINYNGTDLLQTHADSGTPGYVYLDGGSAGTVTLAGSINVDKSEGAGAIAVFAPEIIANGATLSASANAGSPTGYINLITSKITKSGALTINNNGNGGFTADIHLGITPVGSWSVYQNQNNIDFPLVTGPFQASSEPLNITGSGALTITANGDNHAIQIYGYPLTVSSSAGNITQHGTGDALYLDSTDYVNNVDGVLTLGGNIQLHENTTATGATNVLELRGTELAALTGHVELDTSGLTGADGGDITLPFDSGTLALGGSGNTLAIKADGSDSGGKGGNVVVGYGNTVAVTTTGGTAITASAKGGNDDGGNVNINADSIVKTGGSGKIAVDASGTGTAGTITIVQTGSSSNIGLDNTTLSAVGDPNGGGAGNTISIMSAGSISMNGTVFKTDGSGDQSAGAVTVQATNNITGAWSITSNGGCDGGDGGNIEVTADGDVSAGGILAEGGGDGCPSFAPKSLGILRSLTAGNKNGGTIIINAPNPAIYGPLSQLSVDGKGTGHGGRIELNNATPIDISHLGPAAITARGGNDGEGGKVTIAAVSALPSGFSPDRIIRVEGGAAIADNTKFDGFIKLNDVKCQQWRVSETWPYSYWDCANPEVPTDFEKRVAPAANALPFKAALEGVSMYIFNVDSDYNAFMKPAIPANNVYGIKITSRKFFAVFDTVTISGVATDVSEFLRGAAMHEIGHFVDINSGNPSTSGAFSAASAADQGSIAADTCDNVFGLGAGYCTGYADPWLTLYGKFISGQSTDSEMFAFGFQNCSGFSGEALALENAEAKMGSVNNYFNGNPKGTNAYWPGGCR
ncbi:hypothetical protein BH10CYA1_BH10CYA1_43390 [soil metagenome]